MDEYRHLVDFFHDLALGCHQAHVTRDPKYFFPPPAPFLGSLEGDVELTWK